MALLPPLFRCRSAAVVLECRHCGTATEGTSGTCATCGTAGVARYEIGR